VEAQFPNHLPVDIFADARGRPLTVHPGQPPIIFSFRPNVDERNYATGGDSSAKWLDAEPQYDPTNGTISDGSLYYRW